MQTPTTATTYPPTNIKHNIEKTTALLNGQTAVMQFPGPSTSTPNTTPTTDWYKILSKDLEVSPSEDDTPKLATTATNTDVHHNPSIRTEMNTSPVCILDMETSHQTLLTTHGTSEKAKEFLKIAPKTTTQMGCVPLIRMRDGSSQTRYTETVKILIMKNILYYKGRLTSMQTPIGMSEINTKNQLPLGRTELK